MNHVAKADAAEAASAMTWPDFLRPLLLTVRNPPDRADYVARAKALGAALPEITHDMRTPARQRDIMRKCGFWPTPDEILAIFAADLAHARDMAGLQQERAKALPPPDPAQRTPEEIEAVRAKARAFAAEMTGSARDPEREPPKPMPLSDGAMLAHYERLAAQGNEAAATRAKTIKAKMEASQ